MSSGDAMPKWPLRLPTTAASRGCGESGGTSWLGVPLVRAKAASIGASSRKAHALPANADASRAKARAMRGNAGALQRKVHATFATVHATPGNLRATRAKSGAIRGNVGAEGINVPGARGTLRLCSVSLPSIPRGLPREGASVRSVASNVPGSRESAAVRPARPGSARGRALGTAAGPGREGAEIDPRGSSFSARGFESLHSRCRRRSLC
jgi:hypothetical protein